MDITKKEITEDMKLIYDLMASEEMADSIAKMYRNIYDAMKKKGFNDEQILKLLASFNLK